MISEHLKQVFITGKDDGFFPFRSGFFRQSAHKVIGFKFIRFQAQISVQCQYFADQRKLLRQFGIGGFSLSFIFREFPMTERIFTFIETNRYMGRFFLLRYFMKHLQKSKNRVGIAPVGSFQQRQSMIRSV